MSSVIIPQKKQNPVGSLLPMVGAAVGTYYGGSAGGMAGQAIGSKIGGSINKPGPEVVAANERRMAKIDEDPFDAVKRARIALEDAPEEVRDAYKKTLDEALRAGNRNGGRS